MGFIKDLFGKEPADIKVAEINNLITIKKEEDHFLEYKAPDVLNNPGKLSEWVSAFLNAGGGLIIIGVREDYPNKKDRVKARIFPTRIEFVSKDYTKERLELLIQSHIRASTRPVINIHPIRSDTDPSEAIYLIEIPEADNPPYQASDNRYYRRLNATKYPMMHWEIADFFGKRRKPLLSVDFEITKVDINDPEYSFDLRVLVINKGKGVARYARITASFENVEVIGKIRGSVQRIDELRNNLPSIQWDCVTTVIHPTGVRTRICDMRLKVKQNDKPCEIRYDMIAEDVELVADRFSYGVDVLHKAHELLAKGEHPIFTR